MRTTTTPPQPTEADTAAAIRRLEWWHRKWEIDHPDKVAEPTFADEFDMTHAHVWSEPNASKTGTVFKRCRLCPAMEIVR